MTKNLYKNNRRIMLIEPPFYRLYHDQYCLVKYPLALGYLSGAVIKNTDWSVQTYNADFNVEKKIFDPENDYVSGEGFKRYLSSLKDYSLPIWKEVKNSIENLGKFYILIFSAIKSIINSLSFLLNCSDSFFSIKCLIRLLMICLSLFSCFIFQGSQVTF